MWLSDRLGQRHHRFAHDLRVFIFVAVGHLDLAQAQRVLDHHAATLPATCLKGMKRVLHRATSAYALGQHQTILNADARTRGQVRRRGMYRVANQHHSAFEPGLGHQQGFERAKDDARCFGDLFAAGAR